jgi:hypothetical protein
MNQPDVRGVFRLILAAVPALAAGCSNSPRGPQAAGGAGGSVETAPGGASSGGGAVATAGAGGGATAAGGSASGAGGANSGSQAGDGPGGATVGGAGGGSGSAGADAGGGAGGTGCKGATVCYDFEECATPAGWTVPKFPDGEGNIGAGTLLVDKEKAHGGMCSLHMKDFSGNQPQHALLADLPPNFGPILWGRAWVFNTATPTSHGALIKTRYTVPNSTDVDWYEVGYESHNYKGIWHNPLPPSGLPEWELPSPLKVVVNAWTCVEWLFDSQNGTQPEAADPRIWQDGVEAIWGKGDQYDLTNGKTSPRPPTPKGTNFVGIEVGLTMYHQIDQVTNIYVDDLAFGKQRIGCTP